MKKLDHPNIVKQ